METTSNNLIRVCKTSELTEGQSKCVQTNGKDIAVFNVKGKFYAIDNICIHAGGTLNDGPIDLENCQVTCNWHGWAYDLATGKCITHPKQDVFTGTYPVKIEHDNVFVVV